MRDRFLKFPPFHMGELAPLAAVSTPAGTGSNRLAHKALRESCVFISWVFVLNTKAIPTICWLVRKACMKTDVLAPPSSQPRCLCGERTVGKKAVFSQIDPGDGG